MMDMAGELCGWEEGHGIKVYFEGQVEKGRPLVGGSGSPETDCQGEMCSYPNHLSVSGVAPIVPKL